MPRALVSLCLGAVALVAVSACQAPAPPAPTVRVAPRHPIQSSDRPAGTEAPAAPVAGARDDAGRITPGPNSRVTPTPDMAPRVEPSSRPEVRSPRDDVEEMRRDLQLQRKRKREEPGPPAGTIDRRPGTIRTTPGTIEIPR